MSLAIHVFALEEMKRVDREGEAFLREAFDCMNVVLARRGLDAHHEPEEQLCAWPPAGIWASMAYARYEDLVRQLRESRLGGPSYYRRDARETIELRSHLACHSFTSGFFLPQRFDVPLYAERDEAPLPGGLVGSSHLLRDELDGMRVSLELEVEPSQPTPIQEAWQTLRAAAEISIRHGTAIWLS